MAEEFDPLPWPFATFARRPPLQPAPAPWPRPLLIRSSSVSRRWGLLLHPADTWQTNECPFVLGDPAQIAPAMLLADGLGGGGVVVFKCVYVRPVFLVSGISSLH